MKYFARISLLVLFIFIQCFFYVGQNKAIDSLLNILAKASQDTVRIKLLDQLGEKSEDLLQKKNYYHQSLSIARKTNDPLKIAKGLFDLYLCSEKLSHRDSCYYYLLKTYDLAKKGGMDELLGRYYIALPYIMGTYFPDAPYHKQYEQNTFRFHDSAIATLRKVKPRTETAEYYLLDVLSRRAHLVSDCKTYKTVAQRDSFLRAVISEVEKEKRRENYTPTDHRRYFTIKTYVHSNLDNPDSSLFYQKKIMEASLLIGDKRFLSYDYLGLALSFVGVKNYKNALIYADSSMKIAIRHNIVREMRYNLSFRFDLYKAMKDHEKALDAYIKLRAFTDSINTSATKSAQNMYEIQMKSDKHEQEAVLQKAKTAQQQTIIIAGIIVLLMAIVFSVSMVARWRNSQKQKAIIEEQKTLVDHKNKEIIDSIRYAKRIQSSLLPTEKYIERIISKKKS